MTSLLAEIADGFVGLFFPNICISCGTGLLDKERYLCGHCLYDLPVTNFHKERENIVEQIFWGRVPVEYATAFLFFKKGNKAQKLLHQMKYHGQKEVGQFLGSRMGETLCGTDFEQVDKIVPVPIHSNKMRKRGYNQSEWIAYGLSEALKRDVDAHTLVRHSTASSQTRKKRYERWENVDSGFGLTNCETFAGQHILLVDDVITTGATLEASIHAIRQSPDVKVSVATLAIASG